MGLEVILILTRCRNIQPPAYLQCTISGKFLDFYFDDWRHAVHYLFWCYYYDISHSKIPRLESTMEEWWDKFGYSEIEDFINKDDLNMFMEKTPSIKVRTSIGDIKNTYDLKNLDAWNSKFADESYDANDEV